MAGSDGSSTKNDLLAFTLLNGLGGDSPASGATARVFRARYEFAGDELRLSLPLYKGLDTLFPPMAALDESRAEWRTRPIAETYTFTFRRQAAEKPGETPAPPPAGRAAELRRERVKLLAESAKFTEAKFKAGLVGVEGWRAAQAEWRAAEAELAAPAERVRLLTAALKFAQEVEEAGRRRAMVGQAPDGEVAGLALRRIDIELALEQAKAATPPAPEPSAKPEPPTPPSAAALRRAESYRQALEVVRQNADGKPPAATELALASIEADAADTSAARAKALTRAVAAAKAAGVAPAKLAELEFDLARAQAAAAPEPALPPLELRLRDIKREEVARLRLLHKFLADRVRAGLAREQQLLLALADLRAAEAELAPTPPERTLFAERVVEALRRVAALDDEILSAGSGAGATDPPAFVAQVLAVSARLSAAEAELARLRAAAPR